MSLESEALRIAASLVRLVVADHEDEKFVYREDVVKLALQLRDAVTAERKRVKVENVG